MQKPMLALISAAAFAFGASAAALPADTGTTFAGRSGTVSSATPDSTASGDLSAGYFWFGSSGTVADDSEAIQNTRASQWVESAGTEYLSICTSEPLYRTALGSETEYQGASDITPVDVVSNLYIDTQVKFTACEIEPVPSSDDKILVWLGEDGYLKVTAGYFGANGIETNTYATTAQPTAGTWYRLTVRAVNSVTSGTTPAFMVYLNGQPLAYDSNTSLGTVTLNDFGTYARSLNNLYPSLVQTAATVKYVAYQGLGAADDILFTTTAPDFAITPVAMVNGVYYPTLEAAIAASSAEHPVELLADVGEYTVAAGTTLYVKPGNYNFTAVAGSEVAMSYTEAGGVYTYTGVAGVAACKFSASADWAWYGSFDAAYAAACNGIGNALLKVKLDSDFAPQISATYDHFYTLEFEDVRTDKTEPLIINLKNGDCFMQSSRYFFPENATLTLAADYHPWDAGLVAGGTLDIPAGITVTLDGYTHLDGISGISGEGLLVAPPNPYSFLTGSKVASSSLLADPAWQGTFSISNSASHGVFGNIGNFGNANSTIRFNGFTAATFGGNGSTYDFNVELAGDGLTLDGDYTRTFNFTGDLTGSGAFNLVQMGGGDSYVYFKGDVSGFTGDIALDSTTARIVFGDSTSGGGGSITVAGGASVTNDVSATWTSAELMVAGDLTVNGTVTASGTTTVNGTVEVNGSVVSGGTPTFAQGSNVTIADGATWQFPSGGGVVHGNLLVNGSITGGRIYSNAGTAVITANSPQAAPLGNAATWRGTYVIDWSPTDAFNPNNYGNNEQSTVVLKRDLDEKAYFGSGAADALTILPTVRLDADVEVKNGFSAINDDYLVTFTKLTGTGDFTTSTGGGEQNNQPKTRRYAITTLENYEGTLNISPNSSIALGTNAVSQAPAAGACVVPAVVSGSNSGFKGYPVLSVAGSEAGRLVYDGNAQETGLYKALVQAGDDYYLTIAAARADSKTAVTLLADSSEAVVLPAGSSITIDKNGYEYADNLVTTVEGYHVAVDGGVYTSTLDSINFTLDVPANVIATVKVNGEPIQAVNGVYTVASGTEVTVEYAAVGAYIVSNGSQTITPTSDQVVAAPQEMTVVAAAAQIVGGDYYASLGAAVEAAGNGDAVQLLDNAVVDSTISISKNLLLDLGGYSLSNTTVRSGESVARTLQANTGNIVVTNGVIYGRVNCYDDSTLTIAANTTIDGYVLVWGDGIYGQAGCKTPTFNLYGTIDSGSDTALINGNGDTSRPNINVFDGAVIESDTTGYAAVMREANFTMTGGTIESDWALWATNSVITVSGGAINGGNRAIDANGSTVALSGGAVNADDSGIGLWTGSTLTMTGGSIVAGDFGVFNNGLETSGTTMTISGGTITSTNGTACAIYQAGLGSLTLSGTAVVSGADAVEVRAGTVQVLDNAQLIATAAYSEPTANGSGSSGHGGVALLISQHTTENAIDAQIAGGEFSSTDPDGKSLYIVDTANADPVDVEVEVTGGTFNNDVELAESAADVGGFVSGGEFASVVDESVCAPGFIPVTEADPETGMYEVKAGSYVARNTTTGTGYETLAEAIGAVANGQTVVLLADVNEAVVNTADKTFTIDLNGQTWSSDSDVLATSAGTITINATNGGTMTTEAAQCCAVWAKGGDVVINGGTFVSKDNEEATIYVSNANSVITINGGTFQNTDPRPYRWKNSLAALTLNVKNDLAGQHLIINGGTFYGNDPQLGDDTAGGTSAQSSVAFVSSGFVAIQDGNGNWAVQAGYNVTFDADGGAPAPAAQRVAAGGTATEPTEPAKEGFTFSGWFVSGSETAFDFDTVLDADLELTAAWEQNAPQQPTVDGNQVEIDEVFDAATTASPIVYPAEVTVATNDVTGAVTLEYAGVSAAVPAYYDVSVGESAGLYTVSLKLNENALATIGEAVIEEVLKPAVEVGAENVGVTLTTTNPKLYYGLSTSTTPDGEYTAPSTLERGNGSAMQLSVPKNGAVRFYKLYVSDVPVAD